MTNKPTSNESRPKRYPRKILRDLEFFLVIYLAASDIYDLPRPWVALPPVVLLVSYYLFLALVLAGELYIFRCDDIDKRLSIPLCSLMIYNAVLLGAQTIPLYFAIVCVCIIFALWIRRAIQLRGTQAGTVLNSTLFYTTVSDFTLAFTIFRVYFW